MKKEVDKKVIFGVIAAIVVVLAFFGFRVIRGSDGADVAEREFRKMEAQAKAEGRDPRNDPMLSQLYYQYHPEEKPPAGQVANPMMVGPAPRTGDDAGGGVSPGMLAPPPMRTLNGQ